MRATITTIKKLSVHDGDGLRTTVFFKGCSLQCKWCHNPETQTSEKELAYKEQKCISCGECISLCPANAHSFLNGKHVFKRENCIACGKCASACLGNALTLYGEEISCEKLVSLLLEDKAFYDTTHGGVTFSGGEPLLYAEYIARVEKMLLDKGVSCNIDTSGNVKFSEIQKVTELTSVFLYDIKHMDEKRHFFGTGADNRLIIENLKRLDALGGRTEIRIPLIPSFNDDVENIRCTGEFISTLKHCIGVRVLEYHDLARSKYRSLEKTFHEFTANEKSLSKAESENILEQYVRILR